jgi:cysteinyl-tRNA synthetase
MELIVPDTLSGDRRTVRHGPGRPVTLYVCGPTVYDRAHVGHARTYLYFDLARRFLESEGLAVRHVMNITDFEDKIDARAAELGLGWRALARREEREFLRDLANLDVRIPHHRPRASDFVPQMIRVARRLERTGRVHRSGDEWIYTPPRRRPGANFPTDRQLATHAVVEPGHPFPTRGDRVGAFMIWRRQDPPKASWPSPWGRGVPGWHLECFAMAERYLGTPVDLHGGGVDLIFPHHYAENEIALAVHRTRFSRTFLHTAFVVLHGDKMSKSTGNLVTLRSVLDRTEPSALRWYLLSKPLFRRLEWDPAALARSAEEYARVRAAVRSFLGPRGPAGRTRSARRLAEGVRRDLARGLAAERAFARLRAWSERSYRESAAPGKPAERLAARAAFRSIEERTGLVLI